MMVCIRIVRMQPDGIRIFECHSMVFGALAVLTVLGIRGVLGALGVVGVLGILGLLGALGVLGVFAALGALGVLVQALLHCASSNLGYFSCV